MPAVKNNVIEGFSKLSKAQFDSPTKFKVQIVSASMTGGLKWDVTDEELSIAVKTINIPQFNDETIDAYGANRWFVTRGRTSLFQIQISFKSYNSFEIYQKILKYLKDARNVYPAEQYLDIHVTYLGNYSDQTNVKFSFEDCTLTNISDLTFDHSQANSISEFSAGFKSQIINISK